MVKLRNDRGQEMLASSSEVYHHGDKENPIYDEQENLDDDVEENLVVV